MSHRLNQREKKGMLRTEAAGRADTPKAAITSLWLLMFTDLSSINQTRLEFHFSGRMASGMEVRQTRFMFFVQFPHNATQTMNIRVLVLRPYDTNLTLTSQYVVQVNASGWYQLLLGPEAQAACSQGHTPSWFF